MGDIEMKNIILLGSLVLLSACSSFDVPLIPFI